MNSILTSDDLLKQLMTHPTRGFIERLSARVQKEHFELNKIIDLTFHPDTQVAFRAAWLLDTAILSSPQMYANHLPYLTKRMSEVTNASSKRQYARILMHLTAPDAPKVIGQQLKKINMESVVEQLFDWLIDPKVKVAIKVCAADTLFNLSNRYGWIKEELTCQIEFMLRDGSPAIQSKGTKLLILLKS